MPVYDFIAKDHSGRNFRGSLSGTTEQLVYSKLQNLGYVVLSITKVETKDSVPFIIPRVTLDDVVVFAKLFSTVISTGVTVLEALSALEDQTENYSLKIVIREVREDVAAGMSLADAFAHHPKIFPKLFVSMVRSGELGGEIGEVMERLSDYLERDQELRRAVQTTFFYPKVISGLALVAITYLLRVIVPQFQHVFQKMNIMDKLPTITKVIFAVSDFIMAYGIHIIVIAGMLLLLLLWMKSNVAGRALLDRIGMSIPYLGRINARVSMSRMVRSSGSMLECGVPLLDALEISRDILENRVIEEDMDRVVENVELGGNISNPLRTSRHFPPIVLYMVGAGEQSGKLPEMLKKCAEAMDKELKHSLNKVLVILQIGLLIGIAAAIFVIALAVYLPIVEMVMATPTA